MSGPSPSSSQISGFYGPGSWAAWVIMLASSWVPICLNEYNSNTHFIASTLFTNWAAIDLLRHLRWLGRHEHFAPDSPQEQFINAASAVIFIGTTNSLLQGTICLFKLDAVSATARRKLQKRVFIIYLGLLLPLLASFCGYLVAERWAFETYFTFFFSMYIILPLLVAIGPSSTGTVHVRRSWCANLLKCLVLFSFDCFIRISNLPKLKSWTYGANYTSPSWSYMLSDRCFYVPCAPQKIDEWDQLFPLLVSLTLFFYDFKTWILDLLGRFSKFLGDWYIRVISSFHRTSEDGTYEMYSLRRESSVMS